MKPVAIVPARGGSKRLPRKNIIQFLGKPIIAYTVEAALESGLFSEVLVSTEDDEIAAVGRGLRARVVRRPVALATDVAPVRDVCLHVLDEEAQAGRRYSVFSCLYATSPLRTRTDIAGVVSLVRPGVCDFAMAVTEYPYPPHQALRAQDDGVLVPLWPELVNRRSQDIGTLVVDNGSTYCASVAAFRQHKSFYGPGLRGYLMPFHRSIDGDRPEDLELALCFAPRRAR
jgi:CMP-N-acetylneuraminic acid synthetase